ncbi:sporulation protein YunB [Neobacillus muris]|uniref:sporulation protein YunB n=1 Tax=Neobacillus muris TaxID=2941334 RepID=UPI00203B9760|nr:sporulation protein YunB [Neobacillus muris]
MRKLKKRKYSKGPLPFKLVLVITLVLFIGLNLLAVLIVDKNIEPVLMNIAETRARQISTQAINAAISNEVIENIDINELIVKHEDGEDAGYSFNPKIYNRVIAEATLEIQKYLDDLENGKLDKFDAFQNDTNVDFAASEKEKGIIYNIPLGMATDITIFSNLGPKIPFQFEFLGDVVSNLETKVMETGINNTFLEVYVIVNFKINIIVPLTEKSLEVTNKVKIGDLFLQGKVPQYYNGNNSKNSDVNPVIPLQPENSNSD